MLGTSSILPYKTINDFVTHKDYLTYMYSGVKGFITRGVIQKQYYETFNMSDRLINKNSYYNVENVYTSMNTFLSKHNKNEHSGRKIENLKRLNALYIDIDCYKIGMTQEQVLYELESDYFGRKIPTPTFVINSGRGLYLIWKIDEDRNALPRWTSVQKYLFEQCKEFGADPQSLDAARILRVPYSVNSKNGETVKIMCFYDVKYTLYEIICEYDIKSKIWEKKKRNDLTYPYGEATRKQRRIAAWQAAEFGLELPDFRSYQKTFDFIKKHSNSNNHREEKSEDGKVIIFSKAKTITSMLDGRVNDLFKLFSMRKGEDCNREYALFLCRLWVAERTNNFTYALEQTKTLNNTFDVPFDEKYVETRTKSAETKLKTGKTYKYSLSKIIEALNITKEEQKELEYLCINLRNKAARKKKSNRRAYLSRLEKENKQTKREIINERRKKIAELVAKGKSKKEICSIMNISARTYDRDKAAIVSDGLLKRVKTILEQGMKKLKNKANKAVESFLTTLKDKVEYTEKVENLTKACISPFFQHPNYKRTPVRCSACMYEDTGGGIQLTLWDFGLS